MRLWIDGGSLHPVSRCLVRRGIRDDAMQLLHLAVHLTFADTLIVGTYGGGVYARETQQARAALVGIGFESDCVEDAAAPQSQLEDIYAQAAETLAPELRRLHGQYGYSAPHRDLPGPIQELEEQFDDVIRRDLVASDREALLATVRGRENNGLLVMIAKSDTFWSAVRDLVADGTRWTRQDSLALAEICRVFIHDEHARRWDAYYAPNWHRGRALRSNLGTQLLEGVEELSGPAPVNLSGIRIPPIAALLATRARGDPYGLLEETVRLRVIAKPLRSHLSKVMDETMGLDGVEIVMKELGQLASDLQRELALPPTAVKRSALELVNMNAFLFALIAANSGQWMLTAAAAAALFNWDKIAGFVSDQRRRTRVAVLSQMTAGIKGSGIDPTALDALERGISLHSASRDD